MTINPEDAHSYAAQLHDDLVALTAAVERVANALELVIDGERSIAVRQAGNWTAVSYQVQP